MSQKCHTIVTKLSHKTVDIFIKTCYYIHNDKNNDKEKKMSDYYNIDEVVSSVDQSKADVLSRLDELENKINKIYEIVENLEAKLY
tara:strand:+ start:152 stop:409 length:258 start_codon:yes stop_codon:yes gene_type:complete